MTDDNVFDLDALDNEANKRPFVFRFDGVEYTCPDDLSPDVLELMTNEDVFGSMELLLGTEQWQSIKDASKVFGVQRMTAMLNAYAEHLGVDLGKSPASTVSSRPTALSSKRTSSVSTASR